MATGIMGTRDAIAAQRAETEARKLQIMAGSARNRQMQDTARTGIQAREQESRDSARQADAGIRSREAAVKEGGESRSAADWAREQFEREGGPQFIYDVIYSNKPKDVILREFGSKGRIQPLGYEYNDQTQKIAVHLPNGITRYFNSDSVRGSLKRYQGIDLPAPTMVAGLPDQVGAIKTRIETLNGQYNHTAASITKMMQDGVQLNESPAGKQLGALLTRQQTIADDLNAYQKRYEKLVGITPEEAPAAGGIKSGAAPEAGGVQPSAQAQPSGSAGARDPKVHATVAAMPLAQRIDFFREAAQTGINPLTKDALTTEERRGALLQADKLWRSIQADIPGADIPVEFRKKATGIPLNRPVAAVQAEADAKRDIQDERLQREIIAGNIPGERWTPEGRGAMRRTGGISGLVDAGQRAAKAQQFLDAQSEKRLLTRAPVAAPAPIRTAAVAPVKAQIAAAAATQPARTFATVDERAAYAFSLPADQRTPDDQAAISYAILSEPTTTKKEKQQAREYLAQWRKKSAIVSPGTKRREARTQERVSASDEMAASGVVGGM